MEGLARLTGLILTTGFLGYVLASIGGDGRPCPDAPWWAIVPYAAAAPVAAILFTLPNLSVERYYRYGAAAVIALTAGASVAGFEFERHSPGCELVGITTVLLGWIPPTLALLVGGLVPYWAERR